MPGLLVFGCLNLGNVQGSHMVRNDSVLDQKGLRTTCGRNESMETKMQAGRKEKQERSKSQNMGVSLREERL